MNEREIFHFGILGMKWGVRRYQNKDGTRTELGKKHYSMKDVRADYNQTKEKYHEKFKEIKKQADQIAEEANLLGDKYQKEFDKIKPNEQIKKQVYDILYDDFGAGADDEEYFELFLDDAIEDVVNKISRSKLQKEQVKFDQLQDSYWNNFHELTSDMINKYGEEIIGDSPTIESGKSVVTNMFDEDVANGFTSYIYRHFDDYWVNDIDAKYDAIDRIKNSVSASDYNKYAAKRINN